MNKTILVIGSVTAKQYEPVRFKILREGHKPVIVRLSLLEAMEELLDGIKIDRRLQGSDYVVVSEEADWKLNLFSEREFSLNHIEEGYVTRKPSLPGANCWLDKVYG